MSEAQRILLVDDDPPVLDIFARMVEKIGFQVVAVNNSPDALTIFGQTPFDAIIVDYRLAGMNGVELASRAREIKPNIPVLILTGLIDGAKKNGTCCRAVVQASVNAGDDGYFKGFIARRRGLRQKE